MALILSKETPQGVNAEYWAISNININIMEIYLNSETFFPLSNNSIRIDISGFLNKDARENHKKALDTKTYTMTGTMTVGNNENLRIQAYLYLKTLPEWSSAVDDL